MLQNNLHYFKYSIANPEKHLGSEYVFLQTDPNLEDFVKNVKQIKEILIAIKVISENNKGLTDTEKYYKILQNSLNSYSNTSEFICFANACDVNLEMIKKDLILLKKITNLYIRNREITEITPREWVQALIDTHSSRKKGNSGENKLLKLCERHNYLKAENWNDFKNNRKAVAKFSRSTNNDFGIKQVKFNLGIKMKNESQNKAPDLLIKNNNRWIILEAKHINTTGGGQDKQIKELIKLISLKEDNKNIFYAAFMDGVYSNKILELTEPQIETPSKIKKGGKKIIQQKREIVKNLKARPNSHWFNTAGFIEFLKDLN